MASFNLVVIAGNVTRDPELRHTQGGTAVISLGLAVNRKWFDKQANEKREEVTFVDVTLWGRTAEVAGEYLRKGSPVLIKGRLQLDQWEDSETGQKRSRLKVVGEEMQLLGGKRQDDNRHPAEQFYDPPTQDSPSQPSTQVSDDEVPF